MAQPDPSIALSLSLSSLGVVIASSGDNADDDVTAGGACDVVVVATMLTGVGGTSVSSRRISSMSSTRRFGLRRVLLAIVTKSTLGGLGVR